MTKHCARFAVSWHVFLFSRFFAPLFRLRTARPLIKRLLRMFSRSSLTLLVNSVCNTLTCHEESNLKLPKSVRNRRFGAKFRFADNNHRTLRYFPRDIRTKRQRIDEASAAILTMKGARPWILRTTPRSSPKKTFSRFREGPAYRQTPTRRFHLAPNAAAGTRTIPIVGWIAITSYTS